MDHPSRHDVPCVFRWFGGPHDELLQRGWIHELQVVPEYRTCQCHDATYRVTEHRRDGDGTHRYVLSHMETLVTEGDDREGDESGQKG